LTLRRLAICFAFATWCFLNTWVEFAETHNSYFMRYDPLRVVVAPVLCWEILVAAMMFGTWEWSRRRAPKHPLVLHSLFLVSCCVPLGMAAVAVLRLSPFDFTPIVRNRLFWPVALIIAAVPLSLAILRPVAASRFMRTVFLYSWPVLAIILIQAVRGPLARYPNAAYADGPLAARLNSPAPRVRVVWVIFDELSQTIAFGNRPASLQLPNLDRLRSESFYATAAEAPGGSTQVSMTALTLGEKVLEAIPQGTNDLQLRTPTRSDLFGWSSATSVFDAARALGFNTALVGWFHPYGRELNRSLTKCYWTSGWLVPGIEEPFEPQPMVSAMWDRAKLQFVELPLAGRIPGMLPETYHLEETRKRFSYLLDRARELVADPTIGLSLIHLPVPHPPAIYNRSTRSMTVAGGVGYLDSVALADLTLGILRQSLEQAGLWDRTALLISADHGWRTSMWRSRTDWTAEDEAASHNSTSGIPFLLKLPGQTTGLSYARPFNTVVTRQIILSILGGRLTDPAQVPDSIERY
jgi:hypothetical protein